MDLYLEIAGNQIEGARDYQEDAFLTSYIEDDGNSPKASALIIMADGMGGHAAGNIASNLVVSTFNNTFNRGYGKEEPPKLLRESLYKSNDALKASIQETPALDGMGCTMVTAAIAKGRMWWLSIGDSHLYLLRNGKLEKKNEDHSYGGYLDRMRAQGIEVEPEAGLSRNMLMSAMTGEEIAEVDCPDQSFTLQAGDRVIVASDGLDTLSEDEILQFCRDTKTPKECVDALLSAVEAAQKPRQDNTTVIVVDVRKREAKAAAATTEAVKRFQAPAGEHIGDTQQLRARDVHSQAAELAARQEPKSGPGKGLVIGLLGMVVIGAAAGAWYLFGESLLGGPGREEPALAEAPEPPAAPEQPAQPAPEPPAPEQAAVPEPEPAPEAAPAPEETVAQPAEEAAEPAAEAQPEARVAAGREFRDALKSGGSGPVMVAIPAGTFRMGSPKLSVRADERPEHDVTVKPFAMSKYEVTFAEYERFAKATGRQIPDAGGMDKETHPVIFVSWQDAYDYTQWLSDQTGQSYRLPTEAEWEYAASGGNDTQYWWGSEMKPGMAHCFDCGTGLDPRRPTHVGRFEVNQFGLYDTAGNVLEWVHDCYHDSYNGAPTDGSVWEGGDCRYRVARGGSYNNPAPSLRTANRTKLRPNNEYDTVGIRVARDL